MKEEVKKIEKEALYECSRCGALWKRPIRADEKEGNEISCPKCGKSDGVSLIGLKTQDQDAT